LLDTARMEAVRQEVTRTQQMLDDWYGRNAHERRSRRKRTMAMDTSEAAKPRR
jgi:Tfp pilus assembly protein FimT